MILITVSGAAWHMTAPGVTNCLPDFDFRTRADLEACGGRSVHQADEMCFTQMQQRPPPPSYQASMQEYRLRLLMLERNRMNFGGRDDASPPPSYTKAILDANRQQHNLKCDLLPSWELGGILIWENMLFNVVNKKRWKIICELKYLKFYLYGKESDFNWNRSLIKAFYQVQKPLERHLMFNIWMFF